MDPNSLADWGTSAITKFEEKTMDSEKTRPITLVHRGVIWLACRVGWHKWGEVDSEPIQITGPHILFMSWGEQDGKRTCVHCGCSQNVHRSGFVGGGCENPPWKKSR